MHASLDNIRANHKKTIKNKWNSEQA
jgi:hypothetical protein